MSKRHRPGKSAASVIRHVEELVLATSGEDTFEVVFAVAAARLAFERERTLRKAIARTAERYPVLEIDPIRNVSDELLGRVDQLLAGALTHSAHEATLDAVFELLVPRLAKSDKGQFFTPRHVVDLVMQMLAPTKRDVVVDPACGSGAFLSRARAVGAKAFGCDGGRTSRASRASASDVGEGRPDRRPAR